MATHYWTSRLDTRVSRRRALASTGGLAAGAALLAACGGSDSGGGQQSRATTSSLLSKPTDTTKEAKRGGTLKRSISGDVASLDVHAPLVLLSSIFPWTQSRLVQFKPGILEPAGGELIGDVAESWEFSPDKLQLSLKLRPGVKFQPVAPVNSREVDVQDLVFSWNRTASMGLLRSEVNQFNPNGPILSFTAVDERTVAIKLKEPIAYLLSLLAVPNSGHLSVIPKEAEGGFDLRRVMIGAGPFYLSDYRPSIGFTFKRHPDYWYKNIGFVDQIDMPIISEYAQNVAQLKTGAMHMYGNQGESVRAEDVLTMKREVPKLLLYLDEVSANPGQQTVFGGRIGPRSPFNDERVRQAFSMSVDRDAFIELIYNVTKFRAEGLPMETKWNTDLPHDVYKGWWLDPQGKDFGPNAKYFKHDVAEAKKLLAAAGFANGCEVQSNHFTSAEYGPDFPKHVEVLEGMSTEAGFKFVKNIIQYQQEFIPQYRDGKGNFEGLSYRLGPAAPSPDPAARLVYNYYSGGDGFYGFDGEGKGQLKGDAFLDREILKARAELDDNKRKAIVIELQRYLGQKRYAMRWPGGANRMLMAWAAVKNLGVHRAGGAPLTIPNNAYYWLDQNEAPFRT